MKAGKTLQELAIELDCQQAVKKDMIVDMGALSMDASDTGLALQKKGPVTPPPPKLRARRPQISSSYRGEFCPGLIENPPVV